MKQIAAMSSGIAPITAVAAMDGTVFDATTTARMRKGSKDQWSVR